MKRKIIFTKVIIAISLILTGCGHTGVLTLPVHAAKDIVSIV